jgi:hypothetical protein
MMTGVYLDVDGSIKYESRAGTITTLIPAGQAKVLLLPYNASLFVENDMLKMQQGDTIRILGEA